MQGSHSWHANHTRWCGLGSAKLRDLKSKYCFCAHVHEIMKYSCQDCDIFGSKFRSLSVQLYIHDVQQLYSGLYSCTVDTAVQLYVHVQLYRYCVLYSRRVLDLVLYTMYCILAHRARARAGPGSGGKSIFRLFELWSQRALSPSVT